MCDSKIADIKFNWKENESEAGLASCMLTRGCVLRAIQTKLNTLEMAFKLHVCWLLIYSNFPVKGQEALNRVIPKCFLDTSSVLRTFTPKNPFKTHYLRVQFGLTQKAFSV